MWGARHRPWIDRAVLNRRLINARSSPSSPLSSSTLHAPRVPSSYPTTSLRACEVFAVTRPMHIGLSSSFASVVAVTSSAPLSWLPASPVPPSCLLVATLAPEPVDRWLQLPHPPPGSSIGCGPPLSYLNNRREAWSRLAAKGGGSQR